MPHLLATLVTILCALIVRLSPARSEVLHSRDCYQRIAPDAKTNEACASPVCGKLNVSTTATPFQERLSPACSAYMDQFRFKWRKEHLSVELPEMYYSDWTITWGTWCWTLVNASVPSNPVVVQSPRVANFAMCTIPKAGCSLLRALLIVAQHSPWPVGWVGERARVHSVPWPSLDHFEKELPLPSSFPTFMVSRNPYIRFLSGFLDKMTLQDHGHDWHTMGYQNRVIGRPIDWPIPDSKWGLKEFVNLVNQSMAEGKRQNEHFAPAVTVCRLGQFKYEYLLRLEDMAQWWPCLEDGLGLQRITRSGWAHERKMQSDWYSPGVHSGCYWSPPGLSCAEYYALTRDPLGRARPGVEQSQATQEDAKYQYDIHATNAADKWKEYFDQETGDLLYHIYREDFEAFGYQREIFPP